MTDGLTSPLGDRRDHPVKCVACFRALTWNLNATCGRCQNEVSEGWERADELDRSA